MIVLSSPPPKKFSRYFSIGVGIVAASGIVFTGVVAFTQLPEAWQDPDRPALTRAEVREYLTAITPPRSKWRMLPLYGFLIPFLFIPSFYMWESFWIPITLFAITMICSALLSVRVLLQRTREAEAIRFPLVESSEAEYDAEWYGAYEPAK